jgi:RimJ/RimL family protein N-acetyltransferase
MTTAKSKNVEIIPLKREAQRALARFNETLACISENLGTGEDFNSLPISFWLVLADERIAGYVAVGYPEGQKNAMPGDDVALGWFVHGDMRGQGIAGAAVAEILKHLKQIPVNSVRVDIDDGNDASLKLAARFGFQVSASGTSADGKGWKSLVLAP